MTEKTDLSKKIANSRRRLKALQALIDRGATPGERAAAAQAFELQTKQLEHLLQREAKMKAEAKAAKPPKAGPKATGRKSTPKATPPRAPPPPKPSEPARPQECTWYRLDGRWVIIGPLTMLSTGRVTVRALGKPPEVVLVSRPQRSSGGVWYVDRIGSPDPKQSETSTPAADDFWHMLAKYRASMGDVAAADLLHRIAHHDPMSEDLARRIVAKRLRERA